MGCTFCDIYKKSIGIIYEDDYFFAQFDKFPVAPGHSEVIPKRHVISLLELTRSEWCSLQGALEGTINQIRNTDFNIVYNNFINERLNEKSVELCEMMLSHIGIDKVMRDFNLGINNGKAAGRTIDHLHIHIIPRFFGDVEDYVGGIRHMIPGMGNYKK